MNYTTPDVFNLFPYFSIISSAILNPKAPKEPAKTFSFDYSYWSHTTVSKTCRLLENVFLISIGSLNSCKSWCFISHLAARRPLLCITEPCVQRHRKGNARACFWGLQRLHLCLRPDWSWQILHHDGQAGGGTGRNHSHGLYFFKIALHRIKWFCTFKNNTFFSIIRGVLLNILSVHFY